MDQLLDQNAAPAMGGPRPGEIPGQAPWSLQDIPFSDIQAGRLRERPEWFHTLAGASFVETDTPNYTALLLDHFHDHPEAQRWLRDHWLPEEVNHGRSLRTYVETVWPEFDWAAAYREFSAHYAQVTNVEHLEPDRGLEMVARCVVEVGTSTFYFALARQSPDPVLSNLCTRIAQDEVRHYTYFLRYFQDYAARRPYGRWSILRAEWSRLAEVAQEDMVIATASNAAGLPLNHPFRNVVFAALRRDVTRLLQDAFPARMGVMMLLKPLHLRSPLRRALVPVLVRAAQVALRR